MAEITDFLSAHTDAEFEKGITKALSLPDSMGTAGQVLTSTDDGWRWLNPASGVNIDQTLSISGAAADAAATGAAIAEVNQQIEAIQAACITPEQFGAVGNGTTDDTAAISSAIAEAASRGLPVKLSKTYKVSGGEIATPVTIVGTFPVWTNVASHVGTKPGITPNIVADAPLILNAAITFLGVGFGADLVLKYPRIHFFKCVYYNRGDALSFVNDSGEWRGEVTVRQCAFSNCNRCIVSEVSSRHYTDVEISECAAIYGGTFMYGRFSGWMVTSNHIYSHVAFDGDCANSIFANNYIDGEGTMIRMQVRGSVLFSGNMFYGGGYPADYDGDSEIPTCEFERVYGTGTNVHVAMTGNTANYPNSTQAHRVLVKTKNACFVTLTETRITGGALFSSDNVYNARYINVDHMQARITYGSKRYLVDIVHNVAQVSVALTYEKNVSQQTRTFTTPWGNPEPAMVLAPMVYTNSGGEQTRISILVHFIAGRVDLIGVPADYASDGTIYINATLPLTYSTDSV